MSSNICTRSIIQRVVIGDHQEPGEVEGDKSGRVRATDPNWSLSIYMIERIAFSKPRIYYLQGIDKRHYLREELMKV